MFPSVCHLPSFPLGFYILLLVWYLPYPSVRCIPLCSFSWLTNKMLFLAMLLSLSFIAQLYFIYSFYILLLARYLPYPSVRHIPLCSFSWLTNEMLSLAMLLSLSFIAHLHFLHFHLLFFSGSSIATVFTVICPWPHRDFFDQLLLLSPVISLPTPSQVCPSPPPPLHSGLFYHLTESFSHPPHLVHHSPPMLKSPFQIIKKLIEDKSISRARFILP